MAMSRSSSKTQYECKFQPSHALKFYDFLTVQAEYYGVHLFRGDIEIWFAKYISKHGSKYSWRAWMLKSSTISIFQCKDPHVDDMLDLFEKVDLQHVTDACVGHHSSNMIWESDRRIERKIGPPPWAHLRKYFTPEQEAAAIKWLRDKD